MAGLLDILDSDQARLGIGLLAAAGPSATPMGFGQRLAQGVGYVKQQKDADLERLVKQAQLGDIQAQAALRKAQADKQNRLLDSVNQWMNGGDVKAGNDAVVSQTGGLAPTVENAQIQQSAMRKNPLFGIPAQAIQADLAFNDGKGIAEWLFKRGTPDIQVSNGYAYDKNAVQPGFMPGLHTSQDGKSSLTTVDKNGNPVISAPQGAVDTWMRYRDGDPPVRVPLNSGEEMYLFPREIADFNNNGTLPARYGYAAQNTSLPNRGNAQLTPALQKLILDDARKNGIASPVLNLNTPKPGQTLGLQGESATAPQETAPAKTPTFGLTQSQDAAAKAEAAKAKAVKQAEADVRPTESRQAEISSGNYMLHILNLADKHPGLSTATGLQGVVDPRNYIPGTEAKDFQAVRDQLRGSVFLKAFNDLKGGGAITDVEGQKAEAAIARLQTSQSTEQFKKSLAELRMVVQNGLDRAKANMKASTGYEASFAGDNSNFLPSLPPAQEHRGSRARDTVTGKIYKSNGLSWVEDK